MPSFQFHLCLLVITVFYTVVATVLYVKINYIEYEKLISFDKTSKACVLQLYYFFP